MTRICSSCFRKNIKVKYNSKHLQFLVKYELKIQMFTRSHRSENTMYSHVDLQKVSFFLGGLLIDCTSSPNHPNIENCVVKLVVADNKIDCGFRCSSKV